MDAIAGVILLLVLLPGRRLGEAERAVGRGRKALKPPSFRERTSPYVGSASDTGPATLEGRMRPTLLQRAAGAALLFAALAAPAHAAPAPQAVGAALAAAVSAEGTGTLTYDSATGSGDSVTLANAKIVSPHGDETITIPAIVLTGVADRQPGGFNAAGLAFDKGSAIARGRTLTWATGAMSDVTIPTPEEMKGTTALRPFKTMTISAISVAGKDFTTPATIASVEAAFGDVVGDAPSSVHVHVAKIDLPLDGVGTSSFAGAFLGMLNYKSIEADLLIDSTYDAASHTGELKALTLDIANVGKLTIAVKASDVSPGALAAKAQAETTHTGVKLDSVSVRLDNAGVVERLLDAQAQTMGGTRDDVRQMVLTGLLPFALSFVDSPTFRDKFTAALDTFLKDPHSLTVTLAPSQPVPFGAVMHTALHKPGTLPDLLAASVEANN
jgi:hypothetical protein